MNELYSIKISFTAAIKSLVKYLAFRRFSDDWNTFASGYLQLQAEAKDKNLVNYSKFK